MGARPRMTPHAWALAIGAGAGVQVGATIVATRFIGDQLGPATLAMMRYAIGTAVLLPALGVLRPGGIARRDLAAVAGLGVLQFGGVIALVNWGLHRVPAGRVALIFAAFPLLTMLVAVAAGHERLGWRKTCGVAATMLGVAIAVGGGRGGSWAGEGAVLLAALCGAVCSVAYRPYLRRNPALPMSAVAMGTSVVALAAVAGATEGAFAGWPALAASGWVAVGFIGVSSGVFYGLWLWALRHAAATEVTVFQSLSPVTALALGAALLHEPVGVSSMVGLGCIGAGLVLATR